MANILPFTPHRTGRDGDRRYLVEWEDYDGLTREIYFAYYRAAERFAAKIELTLLTETLADLQGKAKEQRDDNSEENT